MSCLALLYLLTIVSIQCVYAQFSPKAPNEMEAYQPFHLFNPVNGKKLVPFNYLDSRNVNNNVIVLPSLEMPCSCMNYICKCCVGLGFGKIKDEFCILAKFSWRKLRLNFAVEINKRSVISFDLLSNEQDFCMPVILLVPVFSCLRVYDIGLSDGNVHVCISLVFKLLFMQMFEYKFKCFDLSKTGVSVAEPNRWTTTEVQLRLNPIQSYNNKLDGFAI